MSKGIVAVIDPRERREEESFNETEDTLFYFLSSLFDEVYGDPIMIPCASFGDLYQHILTEKEEPSLVAVYVEDGNDVFSAKIFSRKYPKTKVILFPKFRLSYESNFMQVLFIQEAKN